MTYTLITPDGLELSAPARTLIVAGNARTQGERVERALYRQNREAVVRVVVGPYGTGASGPTYAAWIANVRTLLAWVLSAPAVPITLLWQPPNAPAPVYLDVVGANLDLPTDEGEWLRKQFEPLELVFVVRPGLRGDRVILSNLVTNPGFEQAAGGSGTLVFTDSFANANAYAVQAGSAPTVAANVLTVPNGTRLTFGSISWAGLAQWQVRWQWQTGLVATFALHFTDANNYLAVVISGTTLTIVQNVAGVQHTLATVAALGLVSGNWYWLRASQYPVPMNPSPSNDPPDIQAALFNDSAGAIGTQVQTTAGPVATFDAVTALSGKSALAASGATMGVGGAFASVHTMSLFGPGAWTFIGQQGGSTGVCSGAWAQNPAAVFGMAAGAPVGGFGAGRIDLAPGGTINAVWASYTGGAPSGTTAAPTATGDTLQARAWVRSTGLVAVNASLALQVNEYDASGSFLRGTVVQQLAGNQTNWVQLSGSVVMGASTAYASVIVAVVDTAVAGESANGVVFIDNVQLWDQTRTGMTAMPYCELRFAQSPAQLVVSGLLGDLVAPALLQLGTYLASWAKGSILQYAVGRRGNASANAVLTAQAMGYFGTAFTPTAVAVTDASAYGGWYVKATSQNGATWNPRGFSQAVADLAGVFHLLTRFKTADASPSGVQGRARTDEALDPWWVDAQALGTLGTYWGPWQNPLSGNGWTVCDLGQVVLPPFPLAGMTDPTQLYAIPRGEWNPASGSPVELDANWYALLPVDGSVVMGVVNNPSNSPIASVNTSYLWCYVDGLLQNRAGSGYGGAAGVPGGQDGPSASYSVESVAQPVAAHSGGGPGTQGTAAINVNGGADPYLTIDPTQQIVGSGGVAQPAAGASGINQLLAYVTDGAADVLPVYAEIAYSPLYVWPR